MATIRLTQAAVEKLSPPTEGRAYYWDRHLPGFGLRVTPNGAKSWIASYRLADGRKVMETIATLARLPKVEDARQAARESMARAAAEEIRSPTNGPPPRKAPVTLFRLLRTATFPNAIVT